MTQSCTLASLLVAAALSFTPIPAPSDEPDATTLAQAYGSICVTEWGNCEVPPQPLGSVCFCGSAQGFIGQ